MRLETSDHFGHTLCGEPQALLFFGEAVADLQSPLLWSLLWWSP